MRGRLLFGVGTLAAVVAVGSCKDDLGLTSIPADPERYIAFLSGANEPTPITTAAQGLATVTVDGNSLHYRIELSNIDSVNLAHIHRGKAGVSGPVIQDLFVRPRPIKDLDFSGLLVDSTITVTDAVLEAIRADTTYVNVHTTGTTGADGSGGHPGGEIRGQLFRFQ